MDERGGTGEKEFLFFSHMHCSGGRVRIHQPVYRPHETERTIGSIDSNEVEENLERSKSPVNPAHSGAPLRTRVAEGITTSQPQRGKGGGGGALPLQQLPLNRRRRRGGKNSLSRPPFAAPTVALRERRPHRHRHRLPQPCFLDWRGSTEQKRRLDDDWRWSFVVSLAHGKGGEKESE